MCFAARFPLHVTLRVVDGLPSLRTHGALRVVQRAIARFGRRERFRVVEYAVIGNHVHLIVESLDAGALARGMQALEVSLARRLNRLFERRGTFFADRYHARILRTPREVRNALGYVLRNGPQCTSLDERFQGTTVPPRSGSLRRLIRRYAQDPPAKRSTRMSFTEPIDFYVCDCVGVPQQSQADR